MGLFSIRRSAITNPLAVDSPHKWPIIWEAFPYQVRNLLNCICFPATKCLVPGIPLTEVSLDGDPALPGTPVDYNTPVLLRCLPGYRLAVEKTDNITEDEDYEFSTTDTIWIVCGVNHTFNTTELQNCTGEIWHMRSRHC